VLAIVGAVVVLGAVIGGFLMAGGHLAVLNQPNEFVVIGGAALGSMLIGFSPKAIKDLLKQLAGITKGGPSKKDYIDVLVMLYELLNIARRDGLVALESHVEKPESSSVISKYPSFAKNHHALHFMADTLRMMISDAGVEAHDLDALLDADLATHHHEAGAPSKILSTVGDAMPGLGIVAAVLGIVITMGHIDGPPEEIGHHVGAALVGTFLGVLLAYGFMQPLSANLAAKVEAEGAYFLAIKQVLLAFHKGSVPAIAVEFARRSIPSEARPGFGELEQACRAARGK
jgi:chemotaxis protein MotA